MTAHRAARNALSVAAALIAGWVAGAIGFGVWCLVKARKHWGHLMKGGGR